MVAGGSLAGVLQRAQWLDALQDRLRRGLPSALAPHLRVANVQGETLVVLVSTPAWRARMRLETDRILAAAAEAGLPARALVVKVSPERPMEPPRPGTPLSAAARSSLRATAATVSDPALRAEMLRLATGQPTAPSGDRHDPTEDTDGPLRNR